MTAVRFSSVFNFRDLGGLPLADGSVVRSGLVHRADGLHRLAGDDLERFLRLGIRTIVDLRTADELAVTGHISGDGLAVLHLPVLRKTWDAADLEVGDPIGFLVDRYVEMLDEGAAAIAATFGLLADEHRRPLVFHCSAGKDRTGVMAALLLSLLGADDDVVAADYAATAPAMDQMLAWIGANRPEALDAMNRQPPVFRSCPEPAMLGFLDELRSRHGSAEGYLRGIGVGDDVVDELRTEFIDSSRNRRTSVA